jgi:Protein of unknown function (DUF3147)
MWGVVLRGRVSSLQLLFRLLVGGAVVSFFAALGDVVKPKSFAGLFGAAPSVALVTISITILADGRSYAAMEARSMIVGASAFFLYAYVVGLLLMKYRWHSAPVTIGALALWLAISLGSWLVFLR